MASGPTTSWEMDGETVETVSDFIFLGSKITANGDCSYEIKRRLLLGRKVFALIHGPNIPVSYAILLFTASDLVTSTTGWCFLLWLCLFILSGVISPLFSNSILGTYRPGEFIFQCPIFLPFHTVHGVLKARILKWFDIPFSSGPWTTFHQNSPP